MQSWPRRRGSRGLLRTCFAAVQSQRSASRRGAIAPSSHPEASQPAAAHRLTSGRPGLGLAAAGRGVTRGRCHPAWRFAALLQGRRLDGARHVRPRAQGRRHGDPKMESSPCLARLPAPHCAETALALAASPLPLPPVVSPSPAGAASTPAPATPTPSLPACARVSAGLRAPAPNSECALSRRKRRTSAD